MTGPNTSMSQDVVTKKWGPYVPTLITCGAVLLIAGWPYHAFFSGLAFIVLPIWAIWSAIVVCLDPVQLIPRAIKLTLWIATLSLVFGLNAIYSANARHTADRYAHVIEQYKTIHGAYPKDLRAAGLDDPGARVLTYYNESDAKDPMLLYRDTANPFDEWFYDFDHRRWTFHPD